MSTQQIMSVNGWARSICSPSSVHSLVTTTGEDTGLALRYKSFSLGDALFMFTTFPAGTLRLWWFLDRAAVVHDKDFSLRKQLILRDPWRLCTITQAEEVKCVIRLLPIWLCTITYSAVFNQMDSLFISQGAAMDTKVVGYRIPGASISTFHTITVTILYLNLQSSATTSEHDSAAEVRGRPHRLSLSYGLSYPYLRISG
ncbi:uncharacterized protein A4U43_C04F17320 [Asparagus officinalis]|uniref:Uncharacterized protein n=1 Tax=Asparagus officinalis TaxID=4686 RepID=A0A5P1F234_ASPOF|nr:uncharacterized protein A4U43_C04F17320 [Asparagus officinalis]